MAGTVQIMKMQFRQGNKADLIVADLVPGEPVLALDTNEVGIKTSAGDILWFSMANSVVNKAVLASEKGAKGGVPTLDPITGKLVQMPSADDVGATPKARTIAGLPLTSNITLAQLGNLLFPVGATCIRADSVNPGTIYGGTWSVYAAGKMLVGVNPNDTDFNAANKTGGSKTHTQTIAEMPNHDHYIKTQDNCASGSQIGAPIPYDYGGATNRKTEAVGGGQPFDIMNPYVTCYIWQRTA